MSTFCMTCGTPIVGFKLFCSKACNDKQALEPELATFDVVTGKKQTTDNIMLTVGQEREGKSLHNLTKFEMNVAYAKTLKVYDLASAYPYEIYDSYTIPLSRWQRFKKWVRSLIELKQNQGDN